MSFEATEKLGNCGLDSLIIALYCEGVDMPRPEDEIIVQERSALREQIVDYLERNPLIVGGYLVGERGAVFHSEDDMLQGVKDYLRRMRRDGAWIGTPELTAAALLFGRSIIVHKEGGLGRTTIVEGLPGVPLEIFVHADHSHFSAVVRRHSMPIVQLPAGSDVRVSPPSTDASIFPQPA